MSEAHTYPLLSEPHIARSFIKTLAVSAVFLHSCERDWQCPPLLLSPLWCIRVAKTVFVWFIETDSDQAKRVNVLPHLSCSLPASLRSGARSLRDAPGSGPGGEGADLFPVLLFGSVNASIKL